jgi:hypothetical protein
MVLLEGGKPDTVLMHPLDLKDLIEGMSTKVQYTDVKASDVGHIHFKAVSFLCSAGEVKIVSDLNCARGVAWVLQLDTWVLGSVEDLVQIVEDDGNKMMRDSDGDSVEMRMRSYSQLYCKAPGWNARVALPAAA